VEDDFRVRGRLEYRALGLQRLPDLTEIREIPIVRDGDVSVPVMDGKGLDICLVVGGAGCGVPIVTDSDRTPQELSQGTGILVVVVNEAEVLVDVKTGAAATLIEFRGNNSRSLLATVLLGEESVVRNL
jgi:hypothetical protein